MKTHPARVCAVGMFHPEFPIQLESLMDVFTEKKVPVIRMTYRQTRLTKFLDLLFQLPLRFSRYNVMHIQAHSYLNMISLVIALFWAFVLRKKTVVMYYGGGAREFFPRFPRSLRFLFHRVDQVVAAGNYVKSAFEDLGLTATIIPHILDVDNWPYRERSAARPVLLWVRHLRDEYNPLMLLQVFRAVKEQREDAVLNIIGTGELRGKMESYIREVDLQDVNFLDRVSDEELKVLYTEADIFINTTNVDNQPVTVLEAMTCGAAIVTTDVGGIPDIVAHGNTALMSAAGDVGAMVENVMRLLEDPDLYSAMSANGREYMLSTFSPEIIYARWVDLYARIGLELP